MLSMAKVSVKPSGIDFEVDEGEAVMAAALRQGYKWPTVCGGFGQCKTCYMYVLEGEENLLPPMPLELEGLEVLSNAVSQDRGAVRLACQLKLTGDIVVKKVGVRQAGGEDE